MGLLTDPRRNLARTICVVVALVVWSAAPLQARRSASSGFAVVDTDNDAKLDRHELSVAAGRDFDRLDVDKDRYLTRAELAQTRSTKLLLPVPGRLNSAAAFAAADTDRDQKIDKREYEEVIVKAYMGCDRNKDGTIELSDLRHCRL